MGHSQSAAWIQCRTGSLTSVLFLVFLASWVEWREDFDCGLQLRPTADRKEDNEEEHKEGEINEYWEEVMMKKVKKEMKEAENKVMKSKWKEVGRDEEGEGENEE